MSSVSSEPEPSEVRRGGLKRPHITGRPLVTVNLLLVLLLVLWLTVSAARLSQEDPDQLSQPHVDQSGTRALVSVDPDVEDAADFLRAVSGPREAAGIKLAASGRAQAIDLLSGVGISRTHATQIIDRGALPTTLRREIRQAAASSKSPADVPAKLGLDADVLDSLADVGSLPANDQPSPEASPAVPRGVDVTDSGAGGEDGGESKNSLSVAGGPQADVAAPAEDDYEFGDALGDLVNALTPFQAWSETYGATSSTVAEQTVEPDGAVAVTIQTEMDNGLTVETEITSREDEETLTLVTEVVHTETGQTLGDPVAVEVPSVESVCEMATGQLLEALAEVGAAAVPAEAAEPSPAVQPDEEPAPDAVESVE